MARARQRTPKATQLAVERLFNQDRSFTEFDVMELVPGSCDRYVRTVLTRLQDKGRIEAVFDEESGLLHYRKASAAKPFLLGECWQQRFDAAELGANA